MKQTKYEIEKNELIRIIDIAIKSLKTFTPLECPQEQVRDFIKFYISEKESIITPKPQFKNLCSLRQTKNDVLIYFQEGHGKSVNYFWEEINSNKINIERKNTLKKVLKKSKISNTQEYDSVIDLMVPYYQTGMISELDFENLKSYIGKFENKNQRISTK
ncbi:MAG: hypothetical protein ACPGSD_09195 [Flavobacteriales bacterium]